MFFGQLPKQIVEIKPALMPGAVIEMDRSRMAVIEGVAGDPDQQ